MSAKNRQSLLTLPVRPTDIDPEQVLAVVTRLRARLRNSDLTLHLSLHSDPLITVCEHERRTATRLSTLTSRFSKNGVPANRAALSEAVEEWLDTRPVTDTTAETDGIATLGWNRQSSHLGWRVVVTRPSGLTADWLPTLHTRPARTRAIRQQALARARALPVTALDAGDVTVWIHVDNPALSTAVFADLDQVAAGRDPAALYAVFTPGRPVAVAELVPATRLTEESNEPHVMVPLSDFTDMGWM